MMDAGNIMEDNESGGAEIPPSIRQKIIDQTRYIEELESKYERLRVNSEQKYFEQEKNLVDSQQKLTDEIATSSSLKNRLDDSEKRLNDAVDKIRLLEERTHLDKKEIDDLDLAKHRLEGEKHDMMTIIDNKSRELARLTDECNSLSVKVDQFEKVKIEAMAAAGEAKAECITLQHQVSRLSQEISNFNQEKVFLEENLSLKTNELLLYKRENSMKSLELQVKLEGANEELRIEQELHGSQKERNEQLQLQIEEYTLKLKEQKEFQAHSDEQYRNEIQAQENLIELYKTTADQGETHVAELTKAVQELQKLLDHAKNATLEVESLRKEDAVRFEEYTNAKEEEIEKLKKELLDANDLLKVAKAKGILLSEDSVEEFSPSAAAASRLFKSGMTLTQLYSEYVQVTENLQLEKAENERLNEYLQQILQEIEEKAPLMKKQRSDYENCLETIDQLKCQLDSNMLESENIRVHGEETARRCAEITRENVRLKQQSHDLSGQVRMLVKELAETRGTVVHAEDLNPSSRSDSFQTPAQRIISDNLVTFRNIEELQEQNQKLLGIVRDLTDRHEEEESVAMDSKMLHLTEKLQQATEEIEELKHSRDRQEKMVESIVQQRDRFKVLLSQTTEIQMADVPSLDLSGQHVSEKRSPKTPATPKSPFIAAAELDETKNKLLELQEDFAMYRREKGENDKLLTSHLEKFREEASKLRLDNAKISSQLDYSTERFKVLQSNVEGYKKEIAALTEKNLKFTTTIIKHEEKASVIRDELLAMQAKLTKAEITAEHLRSQNEILRNSESRLTHEKEAMARESRTNQLLLANLQTIQNSLEKSECETKATFLNRINELERDNANIRRKLDSSNDHQRAIVQSLEKQLTEARELLGQEDQSHRAAINECKELKIEVVSLKSKLDRVQSQYKSAEQRILNMNKDIRNSGSSSESNLKYNEQIKELKSKLSSTELQIKDLQDQLTNSQKHVQQYKNMADTMEQTLSQQMKVNEDLQKRMESELEVKDRAYIETKQLLKNVEEEKEKLLQENMKLSLDKSSSNTDLRGQLKSLQNELEDAIQRREDAIKNEHLAREDLKEQSILANNARDKYERECILHAADLTSLQENKSQLEGFEDRLRKAEEVARDAREKYAFEKHSWSERETRMKSDQEKLQSRIDEILEQNSNLHDNLEQVSAQMVKIQQKSDSDEKEAADMAEKCSKDPTNKSLEQLTEVIKFLRKENAIASTRFDVVDAECNRYKNQVQFLQKQLSEVQKTVDAEREKAQISIQTAAEHANLLKKVENMNVLQDSNQHLRGEKERLNTKIKELEARSSKLESDIEPLQANLGQLTRERDVAKAECMALKDEIESWRARTNRLVEQCNKFDPEEYKQAIKSRDELARKLSSLESETNSLKADAVDLNMQISNLKNAATSANEKIAELSSEKESLSKVIEKDKTEKEKHEKMVIQLRNIGRKYKNQVEETKNELETLRKKVNTQVDIQDLQQQLKTAQDNAKEFEGKLKTAEKAFEDRKVNYDNEVKNFEERVKVKDTEIQVYAEKLKAAEDTLKATESKRVILEERLKVAEEKLKAVESINKMNEEKIKNLHQSSSQRNLNEQRLEKEKNEAVNKNTALQTQVKTQGENVEQLNKSVAELKESITALEKAKKEAEADRDKWKKIVASAKAKLIEQNDMIEKLKSENEAVQKSGDTNVEQAQRLKVMHSQIDKLNKELEAAKQKLQEVENSKQELERVKKENQELTQQVQKTRLVQATPIQPVRSVPITHHKASASVRPMAVSPATSSGSGSTVAPQSTTSVSGSVAVSQAQSGQSQPQQTPTATVHPTTLEAGDGNATPMQVGITPGRPTQSVQPHVEEAPISIEVISGPPDVSSSSQTDLVPPSTTVNQPALSVSSTTAAQQHTEHPSLFSMAQGTVSHSAATASFSSESGISTSSASARNKRQRSRSRDADDFENQSSQSDAPPKKIFIGGEAAASETEATHPSTATSDLSTQQQEWASSTSAATNVPVIETSSSAESAAQQSTASRAQQGDYIQQESEVVMVEQLPEFVDTESEDGDEEQNQMEPDSVDIVILDDEDDLIEEGQQSGVGAGGEDDEIVIVEDDENQPDASTTEQQRIPEPSSGVSEGSSNIEMTSSMQGPSHSSTVITTSQVSSAIRMAAASTSARSALAPFSFGASSFGKTALEVSDDGIVPSTPTLSLPTKRNDGFAEAVCSPQTSQQFLFGGTHSESSSGPDFAQLPSGLDAPCIDFSQFSRSGEVTGASMLVRQSSANFSTVTSSVHSDLSSSDASSAQPSSSTVCIEVTDSDQQELVVSCEGADNEVSRDDVDASSGATKASESSSGEVMPQQKETPSTSTSSTGDVQDKPEGSKPKIEPIVWDQDNEGSAANSATASRTLLRAPQQAAQQQQQQQQAQGSAVQPQPITSLATGYSQSRPFRHQRAVRTRPFNSSGRGTRGAQSVQPNQMGHHQRGVLRPSRFSRGSSRGPYRGSGHQQF